MIKYDPGVPTHCPPKEAEERDAVLYRICATNPPSPDDYASHLNSKHQNKRELAARKLKRNPSDCSPSGLSVWITEVDMRHACAAFAFAEGRYVFTTEVKANEGKLQPTSEHEHHTYWPQASTNLVSRATLAFGPVDRATVNVD